MNGFTNGFLSSLARLRDARTFRASSGDWTGRNRDNWQIPPGATVVLAERKRVRQIRERLADARRRAAQERQWLKDQIAKAKALTPSPKGKTRGWQAPSR